METNENGQIILKRNSNYYYEIIGQLRITKKMLCYFVVYTPNHTIIEEIEYDPQFWCNMKSKLEK